MHKTGPGAFSRKAISSHWRAARERWYGGVVSSAALNSLPMCRQSTGKSARIFSSTVLKRRMSKWTSNKHSGTEFWKKEMTSGIIVIEDTGWNRSLLRGYPLFAESITKGKRCQTHRDKTLIFFKNHSTIVLNRHIHL